jgi:hypothetical protein
MRAGEEEGIVFDRRVTPKWLMIAKYSCIMCFFFLVLLLISLFLLYAFGGDEFAFFFSDEKDNGNQPGYGYASEKDHPVRPTTVAPAPTTITMGMQKDVLTMSPTLFAMSLPDYTMEIIENDSFRNGEDAAPQTSAFEWIQYERQSLADKFTDMNGGTTTWFEGDRWINRFALATFFFATSQSTSKVQKRSERTVYKTGNWIYSTNWLSVGVSECEWSFYSCEGGDSLWITKNGLHGT